MNGINSVPQTAATTFDFSSVFILMVGTPLFFALYSSIQKQIKSLTLYQAIYAYYCGFF